MTRNRRNANANTEGVVQEFIGTAYDDIKLVADNLDQIQLVVDAINNLDPDAFATAAQGLLADSALQPEDIQSLALLNAKVLDATLIASTDARLSDARTPLAHTHSETDITDLQTYLQTTDIDTLAELNALIGDATLIDTADSRLSDARTPTAHTHPYAELTSMPTTLAGYGITNAYTKTEIDAHTHAWSTITSKPTTLAGYGITDAAPLSHVGGDMHINWKVTGPEVIHPDRYTDTNTVYTHPATHPFSILTGLPTTLAGYGISDNVSALTNDAGYLVSGDIDTLTELNLILSDATLGDSADFATAAQGALATSASQPGHVHTSADITDMGTFLNTSDIDTLAELNAILTDATLIDTGDARLSNARTPTAHTHTEAEITDLGSYLASTAINTLAKLNTVVTDATLIDTSDARLSDNRDPNAHTHTEAEITDLGTYVTQSSISTLAGLNALVLDATLGDASDFATAAQGTKADSAVQPADIGTAAAQDVGYFATAAQGALADSALQSIAPDSITMDMLVDINTDTFLGRVSPVSGTVEVLTNAQAKAALDLVGTNSGDQFNMSSITDTKANFDASVSDATGFAYAGAAYHNSFSDYVADEHLPSSTFATAAQGTLADSALQPGDIDTLAELNAILTDATLGDTADFITISTIAGRMLLKGAYDADTNTPDLDVSPSGIVMGDTYYVSVAGSFFGSVDLEIGDKITALNDDPTTAVEWTVTNKNLDTADFATAEQGTLADSALQTSDIDTLAKLNAIVAETLIDDTHAGLGPDEGVDILSTGITTGKILTAQGDNSSAWDDPPAVEGTAIVSTAVTAGKVLQADGDATCSWVTPFTYASTLTTKGDLEGFGTVRARLPVGTNGQVLVADSAQALGIGWANLAAPPDPGFTYDYVTTNVTISEGADVFSDAGLTHNLPSSPVAGERCRIRDFSKGAGINAITIQRNGSTINGAAVDFVMDEAGQIVTFMCDTAGNWLTSSVSDVPEDPAAKTKIITDTTYTILEADNGYRLLFNNASAIAVTIPDGLSLNHHFTATQINTGVPTLTPVTDTVNGAGTGVTPDNQWGSIYFVQYAYADWLAEYSKAGSYLSLP